MQNAAATSWAFEPDIMDISGRLDDGTAPALEEDALLCIRSGARRMIFDCRELTYVTAAGLRAMLNVAREMQMFQGSFGVCELQPQVEDMLRVTGLCEMISIFGSRNEAITALAA